MIFKGIQNKSFFNKKTCVILITIFSILCCTTCKDGDGTKKHDEGYIEYNVTYLQNKMEKNIPTNLLPKKMVLKFRDNMSLRYTEGFMGLFTLTIITNHKKHTTKTLMKVLGKKYYYEGEKNEPNICFQEIPGMEIDLKKGTKVIAGLRCKRGQISYPGKDHPTSTFYYTEEIDLDDPNFANPYKKVDGVLVEFEMKLHKLIMKLNASEVYTNEISDKEFIVPPDYKKVSKNSMMDILSTLLE